MTEDELTNELIRRHREDQPEYEESIIEPEAHYNYYGDRGSVDLHVKSIEYDTIWEDNDLVDVATTVSGCTEHVYEIKSDAAIRESTGANEIIRQFKRHCKYFYRDESRSPHQNTWSVTFELCFVASPVTWAHVEKNLELYRTVEELQPYVEYPGIRSDAQIAFRLPNSENLMPVMVFRDGFREIYTNNKYYNHVTDAMGL